ncbi:MAG: hypothetical protein RL693_1581 [Verrucomicrobiota bacterium]|jgi:hypothetical protein
MPLTTPAIADEPKFQILFDAEALQLSENLHTCSLHLPMPVLHGRRQELWHCRGGSPVWHNGILLMESGDEMFGAIVIPTPDRMEDPLCEAYTRVLEACSQRQIHLHRVWNYVSRINAHNHELERYRQFNIGRWMAFEKHFGRDLRAHMPAASAVGITGDHTVLFFIAGKTLPIYLENPSQVPAYHYPHEYGPKPPSFARGLLVQGRNVLTGYLSGTASIEGHQSIGEGDWHKQFRTTMHNMEIMLERMGMAEALQGPSTSKQAGIQIRDFKCYVRHPESAPMIQEWLMEELDIQASQVTLIQAEICRAELDLEIEAIFAKDIQH